MDNHLGDPNAPVKVDVYEDFRCSACLYYTQNVEPQIIQNYVETGKVYYTYHFFIVIDGNDGTDASYRSANAALCAGEQGHFWDYHDTLYANQIYRKRLPVYRCTSCHHGREFETGYDGL